MTATKEEHPAIERLKGYKRVIGRIRILERTPIGNGMYLQTVCEDDKLQDLHRQLAGMPSYMYLTKHEQELETTAHAYLTRYPLGTKAQLEAVPRKGYDAEADALLQELRRKIRKVIEARGGQVDDFESVLDRLAKLDGLKQEKEFIEHTLDVFDGLFPQYAKLLRLLYLEEKPVEMVIVEMRIVRRTFERWRLKATEEYCKLAGT